MEIANDINKKIVFIISRAFGNIELPKMAIVVNITTATKDPFSNLL